MQLNQAGTALIRRFESCELTCYKDIVGLLTIGWGHRTMLPLGTAITQAEANRLLDSDLTETCTHVKALLTMDLTDNQFSAIICLVFNIGVGNFKTSTLLKLLNGGGFNPAADQFLRWDHAGGKEVPGLLRRRQAERDLFLT